MKRYLLSLVLVLVFSSTALAAEKYLDNRMTQKLKRGGVDVVTAPLELPKEIMTHWKEASDHPVEKGVYLVGGLVKGCVKMVGRFGSGLWDVLTFNLDIPKGYTPLMK